MCKKDIYISNSNQVGNLFWFEHEFLKHFGWKLVVGNDGSFFRLQVIPLEGSNSGHLHPLGDMTTWQVGSGMAGKMTLQVGLNDDPGSMETKVGAWYPGESFHHPFCIQALKKSACSSVVYL